jgi:iron complex transport system ATP-binding protein
MALIEIDRLSFGYRRAPVIKDLDLSIKGEGVTALLGPNGSGKTTLLKLLLGLLAPTSGRIRLRGDELCKLTQKELACRLAYVPQVHKEAFGYSVFDVVLMGRMPRTSFFARYGETDRRAAREAMEKLSISHLGERPYTEISGGERQLTLIARALAQGADVFVMDEPTNGLDYGNQLRLLDRIGRLAEEGYTFIYTTHHPDHALAVADNVVMMKAGRILREGPPQTVLTTDGLAELYGLSDRLCAGFAATQSFAMPQLRAVAL